MEVLTPGRRPLPAHASALTSTRDPLIDEPQASPLIRVPDAPGHSDSQVIRVCRSCLTAVRQPDGERCPACGGTLAPARELEGARRVRNPMTAVHDERRQWIGRRCHDFDGARLGDIAGVLLDPETDVVWLLVKLPRNAGYTLVPLRGAVAGPGQVINDTPRARVKTGPRSQDRTAYLDGPFRSLAYRHHLPPVPRRRGELA